MKLHHTLKDVTERLSEEFDLEVVLRHDLDRIKEMGLELESYAVRELEDSKGYIAYYRVSNNCTYTSTAGSGILTMAR